MNNEDVQIRAARAQQLLEDEVFQEALTDVFAKAAGTALVTDLSKPHECIAALAAMQAADAMADQLKSFITTGKAAERKPFKVA